MSQKTVISLVFPNVLLRKIDKLAKDECTTRSGFIRQVLLAAVRQREQREADKLKRRGRAGI